ncbi:Trehalose transport system permease protein SugB [Dickeya dianthicola]|uniref:sn-glycerol-3-phosphate transport system permease protein UgpE n=1 Tax=Dickeya dianthicola TaxID=204039 RepID=A0AAP6RXN8_9GAMM|nr:carbohydrate ABC transporter permease [Dickeya dianthicola]AYC17440.1 Trehalose transport system permease protein SugB [Dickeya dianthicola]MBI0438478.1 carbohydrate ABC transporter permease [Dickeya dianthicola]MBI0450937.1 carbohydrate ABC transporter permease [Dickeya dianthicola]MBI0453165.1 carbohydrate ABC transporter permease [Dickeya dianthicola]MBI0459660.1 carbohydrate ABC transporter permease [Dickeya dianthicola]
MSTPPAFWRVLIWIVALMTVLPFGLALMTSFKTQTELFQGIFTLPSRFNLDNYLTAWQQGHFNLYFMNSILVVVPVVISSLLLGILSGFGFAFLRIPGKRLFAAALALGMVLPSEAFIIPLYHELHWLGLTNSYLALILPQVALSMPFATLMIASAFQQVPRELLEASVMDGAPRLKILWGILVPAIWPMLSTLALLLFIWTWNEFLIPLILVNRDELRTLPIGMMFFQNKNTINIPVLMAGAMIVILPLIAIFLCFQRKFISGVTEGAVK